MAEQTSANSSSRWRVVNCCSSQNCVIGMPFTSSMTKYGRPLVRGAGVEDSGDVRMVHHGQRLALGFEARDDFPRVHAGLDDLERDAARHRLDLFGHPDHAESALADLLEQFVAPDALAGLFGAAKGRVGVDVGAAGEPAVANRRHGCGRP